MTVPLLALLLAAAQAAPPPVLAPDAAFDSSDCVSVHADGDPVDACGFQAMAISPAGDRIVTVSTLNAVQLWGRDGRELARTEALGPSYSGYPSAAAVFVGGAAVALADNSNLVVFDARTGALRLRRRLDMHSTRILRAVGPGRILIEHNLLPSWQTRYALVDLASGDVVETSEHEPPHPPPAAAVAAALPLETGCRLVGARPLCVLRPQQGRMLRLFDPATRRWQEVDSGVEIDQWVSVEWIEAGGQVAALICERGSPDAVSLRQCRILDLERRRTIYRTEVAHMSAAGGADENGAPEIRVAERRGHGGSGAGGYAIRRIGLDGRVREVAQLPDYAAYWLNSPRGDLLYSDPADPDTVLVVRPGGAVVGRLPIGRSGLHRSVMSADGRTLTWWDGGIRIYTLPAR